MVQSASGLNYHLACKTQVQADTSIILNRESQMLIAQSGANPVLWATDKDMSGLGIAVDLGTTTIACRLLDLASGEILASMATVNPQVVFGADVLSRIDACNAGKLDALQSSVIAALNKLISSLCQSANQKPAGITRLSVAGNTVMQHILCGLSPVSIGISPFTPLSLFGSELQLDALCLPSNVTPYIAPCVAGYVGGDITAGILATAMTDATRPVLFIDLGTNGELALGDSSGIRAAATAAGPVFEGANIRFGMPALPGAICAVNNVENNVANTARTLPKLETIGNVAPLGFCGTGIIDIIAWMLDVGIVDSTGMMVDAGELPEYLASTLGSLDGQKAFFPLPDSEICITQADIRNLQLGKGAVAAGISVLINDSGIELSDIATLNLAGGFGRKLKLESAARIGLFPAELLPVAKAVGNSAIEGAHGALVSSAMRAKLAEIAKECRYIELSTSLEFNRYFMEEMLFPN
jgi:uncharacterized 2Fe-2S/4Fe-4S cluster protein (DUF4445 family)